MYINFNDYYSEKDMRRYSRIVWFDKQIVIIQALSSIGFCQKG